MIDGSNLARNIEQLQAALRDAENQVRQIEELRRQVELQVKQITNLEGILGSISGLNDIAGLYNSATDIRDRAAKITDLSGFTRSLSVGDFDGLLASLLDGDVTMGERRAADAMKETLSNAGFTAERLQALTDAEDPQGATIANTAAANATAIAAAQISYGEAGASIERIDGLVGEIAKQKTMKESIDLNTRMAGRDQLHARPDVAAQRGAGLGPRAERCRLGCGAGPDPRLLRLFGSGEIGWHSRLSASLGYWRSWRRRPWRRM